MHADLFHVEIILQIIEAFLDSIFCPVYFKSLDLILDIFAGKDKPADMILFVLNNGIFVEFDFDATYRRFFDKKELVIILFVFFVTFIPIKTLYFLLNLFLIDMYKLSSK